MSAPDLAEEMRAYVETTFIRSGEPVPLALLVKVFRVGEIAVRAALDPEATGGRFEFTRVRRGARAIAAVELSKRYLLQLVRDWVRS